MLRGATRESVKEAITVAETAGVPLVISHHKTCGRDFWGKSKETLRLVEEAVARGMKILIDQYPYEANMTSLNVCIPPCWSPSIPYQFHGQLLSLLYSYPE